MSNNNYWLAKAFVSCSLRKEDELFTNFIVNILQDYRILPFGTVGRFDASTQNPVELMQTNIKEADFIVVIATQRYITKDSHYGKESTAISEMLHVEAGMAFAHSKPVVVFVQEGTNVGNFIPAITQYIVLNGSQEDLNIKYGLIEKLLNFAFTKSQENKQSKEWGELKRFAMGALALYGGITLLNKAGTNEESD